MENQTPFSKSHVLRITARNVAKAINMSIRKSHGRLKDRPDCGVEILETIDVLYKQLNMNEEFVKQNKHLYEDNKS